MQVCPLILNLQIIAAVYGMDIKVRFVNHLKNHDHAPSTASSMLASAKTMKGALPPASKDTLHTQIQKDLETQKKGQNLEQKKYKLLQSTCRHFVQQLRNRCRPGEADFFDDFILAHFFTDFKDIFLGCDDIDDTIRDTCATTELFQNVEHWLSEKGIQKQITPQREQEKRMESQVVA